MIYLDHAASTPLVGKALEVLNCSMKEDFANLSSSHRLGKDISKRVDSSRNNFLKLLGGDSNGTIIFTSSATESNNTILKGVLKSADAVWVLELDHPSVVKTAQKLVDSNIIVKNIPHVDGVIDYDEFIKNICKDDKMVVLTSVNNSSGMITDVLSLSKRIKKINPNIHIHLDSVQGFGKIEMSLVNIDSVSISSHKIGGPKGVALLYLASSVNKDIFCPLIDGGEQEFGLRSSTVAAPLIFSFEAAAKYAEEHFFKHKLFVQSNMVYLQKKLKNTIKEIVFWRALDESMSPYILLMRLPGVSSDIIVRHLEMDKIFISSSSACSSRVSGENRVYTALGISKQFQKEVIRVSISFSTTEQELDLFIEKLSFYYDKLRKIKRKNV